MARLLLLREAIVQQHLRRERIFRDRENPLDYYRDDQLYQQFRFDRDSIMFITDLIGTDLNSTRKSQALLPSQQVLIALQFYATGTFHSVCGNILHVSKATANRAIWLVSNALVAKRNDFIRMPPSDEQCDKVKAAFFKMANFPGVLGCVDGTHVRITKPTENAHQFINRKFYPSINVQAICMADGQFSNIVAKWPGSTHDSRMLKLSHVYNEFQTGMYDGVILGDSGYPCLPWLMTPYRNPSNQSERKFNTAHRKTRVQVEQTFGRLKRRIWGSRL